MYGGDGKNTEIDNQKDQPKTKVYTQEEIESMSWEEREELTMQMKAHHRKRFFG